MKSAERFLNCRANTSWNGSIGIVLNCARCPLALLCGTLKYCKMSRWISLAPITLLTTLYAFFGCLSSFARSSNPQPPAFVMATERSMSMVAVRLPVTKSFINMLRRCAPASSWAGVGTGAVESDLDRNLSTFWKRSPLPPPRRCSLRAAASSTSETKPFTIAKWYGHLLDIDRYYGRCQN